MISKQTKTIDYINIGFDKKFIRSLTLLANRKIEPVTTNVEGEEIIIGIKCPVVMDVDTFEEDKKIIESDIIKAFADILKSEICNRKRDAIISQKILYNPFPCPVCGSANTIGNGHRKTGIGMKAKRQCKTCGKNYTNQEGSIWKMKNRRDVIEEALNLAKYNSLRDTARLIKEKFNIEISHSAILYWQRNKKLQNNTSTSN